MGRGDSAPEHIVSVAIAFAGGGAGVFEELTCRDNVIAGNRIDGHPTGIILLANPGGACRENTIRGNRISVTRLSRTSVDPKYLSVGNEQDSTAVGVPIQLYGQPGASGMEPGRIDHNVLEGNEIFGAEGVAIELTRASRNRILDNALSEIRPRVPFPGNALGLPAAWADANRAAIWISSEGTGNEIRGNGSMNVAGPVVALEGDNNRVSVEAGQSVTDMGRANEVSRSGVGGG